MMTTLSNEPFHFSAADGSGNEAFLLLHGLGGGVYEMRLLADRLHQAGYTVVGINYPGHDSRSSWMPASSWQQWYQHVEMTYQQLVSQHAQVSIIGFSTGCMLALHLAACYQDTQPVHRLVLLSPFLKVRKAWYYLLAPEIYVRSIGRFIHQVPRLRMGINDRDMNDRAYRCAYFKTFNLTAVRSALDLIHVVSHKLESIHNPALIIQSHRDSVVCPSGAHLLMNRLGSSTKEIHWLKESNHVILLDCEREAVMDRILEFVALTEAQLGDGPLNLE